VTWRDCKCEEATPHPAEMERIPSKIVAMVQASLRDAVVDLRRRPASELAGYFQLSLRDKATRSAWKNASDSETSSRWSRGGIFVFCTVDVVGSREKRNCVPEGRLNLRHDSIPTHIEGRIPRRVSSRTL